MFREFIDDFKARSVLPEERERVVRDLIERCGYASAALTLIPLPKGER